MCRAMMPGSHAGPTANSLLIGPVFSNGLSNERAVSPDMGAMVAVSWPIVWTELPFC